MNASRRRAIFAASTLLSVGALAASADDAKPAAHHWDYGKEHGPEHWAEMDPKFAACKTGRRQSPIDIQKADTGDLPPIQFDYRPSPLRIVDNGHTVMVTYAPGSSIRVGDHTYTLQQFHFHRPSEERVHGQRHAMSLHLVHADAAGQLAVVGVLLDSGRENPLLRELWNDLPREKEKEERREDVTINAADLLPAGRGYYTFEGSLTTPPCSENVTWFVLKEPVSVSAEEIARFEKLYRNDARPVQPLNDRVVRESR
jgi:carbonic anhydrase